LKGGIVLPDIHISGSMQLKNNQPNKGGKNANSAKLLTKNLKGIEDET